MPVDQPWRAHAQAKVAATLAEIPAEWVLSRSDFRGAAKQRQLSGAFIEKFLDGKTLKVIRNDSLSLVKNIQQQK